jgi:replicative DNA helicase
MRISPGWRVLRQTAKSAQLAINHNNGVTGVTTGFRNLDRQLGGLQPSDLIILAGRHYRRQCGAAPCADGGKKGAAVGFFSLEMSGEQMGQHVLAEEQDFKRYDAHRAGQIGGFPLLCRDHAAARRRAVLY